jgi:hypothetical protein
MCAGAFSKRPSASSAGVAGYCLLRQQYCNSSSFEIREYDFDHKPNLSQMEGIHGLFV